MLNVSKIKIPMKNAFHPVYHYSYLVEYQLWMTDNIYALAIFITVVQCFECLIISMLDEKIPAVNSELPNFWHSFKKIITPAYNVLLYKTGSKLMSIAAKFSESCSLLTSLKTQCLLCVQVHYSLHIPTLLNQSHASALIVKPQPSSWGHTNSSHAIWNGKSCLTSELLKYSRNILSTELYMMNYFSWEMTILLEFTVYV